MFQKIHQANVIVHFLRDRLPFYGPLAQQDVHELRGEIVGAAVGAGILAAAGILLACFLSIAVIVSAWDSHYRIMAAWFVCLVWAAIATGGFLIAFRALSGRPSPFRRLSDALARDYARLVATVEGE